jgi:DNA polymerase-1
MFWRYNALDAAVTREIQLAQRIELQQFGTQAVFQHEMSLLQPLMACANRGIPLDIPAFTSLRTQLENEIASLQLILDTIAGRPINVSSYGLKGDVGQLLYDQLKLPVQYNKETRQPSVDKDALIKLAASHPHPALLTILSIRERRTILQGPLSEDIVDHDFKVRTNYDPTGTRTGRLNSRAPIIGKGTNMQNQTDKVRRLYVPIRGRVFIQPDYSQAEARVVAYLAREQALIDLLEDPTKDIHRFNASRVYGCAEKEVSYEMRFCAKRGTHSANYGVGAEKTMMVINQDAKDTWGKPGTGITVDLNTARQIVDGYFALYPRIKTIYWTDVVSQLKRDRTLTGVFGRKRTFFGRWDGGDEGKFLNAAYSYIPQNAVGDLCTMAMVRIEDSVKDATVLGNVHDSILVECEDDPNVVERVVDQMATAMKIPLTVHGKTFYIPTEFAVGYNWGKAGKDGSNPQGLKDAHKWLEERRKNFVTV